MDLNSILDDYKENEVLVCNNFSEITFDHSEQCSISIMHVNIRSIYQNFDQFLAFLGTAHELFDVIVMSETHFIHNTNDFGIPGYVNFFNESKLNKCDGCAIYVKNNWFVSYHVLVENTLRINKILLEKNGKQVEVLATYRGFGETKETFINNLNSILEKESSGHNKIQIFTGDINIDLLSLEEETTNNYLSLMQRHGFVSIINKPTRKTNNTKSCLDHFFVKCKNSEFQNIRGTILECGLTDHDAILLHIATKKHIIKRLKPWISAGLLVSIRNRDHLKKESTLNPNNLIFLQKYRDYRKMLSKLIKKQKLCREIQSLKEGVKGGDDCISSSIVKQYKDFLKKPLLHIVNKIFVTGQNKVVPRISGRAFRRPVLPEVRNSSTLATPSGVGGQFSTELLQAPLATAPAELPAAVCEFVSITASIFNTKN
nr:unnamed protein product [Callosobruchus analis]